MSSVDIKQVGPSLRLGEGPHWVEEDQALLLVNIYDGDLHRLFIETGRHQVLHIEAGEAGSTVTFVIPVEGDRDLFIVSLGRSIAVVRWSINDPDRHSVKAEAVLHVVDDQSPTNILNDGKCDPEGRLWSGTVAPQTKPIVLEHFKASIYRMGRDLKISHMVDKISLSNGLAWSLDKKTFYYIDSLTYRVDAFDFEVDSGNIANRRTLIDYKAEGLKEDLPDGMCVDEQGNLWVANFSGKKVICIDSKSGKILRTLEMPAHNPTSVCFGGKDYGTLFVTSGTYGLKEGSEDPLDGATFAVTGLGVKGLPPTNFKADMNVLKIKLTK